MNRLLILNLIIFSISLVNCEKFYLGSMCKNEVFDFEDQKVNAYYRINLDFNLRNLSSMQLSQEIKFDTWTNNETEIQQLNQAKDQFNKLMQDFYSRQIDQVDSSIIFLHKKAIFKIWDLFSNFKTRIGSGESSSLYAIDSTIKAAAEFLHDLLSLKSDLLAPNLIKKDDLKTWLIEIEKQMKLPTTESFVFENHASNFYYNKRILKMINFDFEQVNKTAKALFSVYIPVFSKEANQYQCRNAKLLPAFFNQL